LTCQKHSLTRQSGTKLPVKLTLSKKITVLSAFLEFSLNLLSNNNKKNTRNRVQSRKKAVSNSELSKTQFKKTVRDEISCKTHLE